MCIGMPTLFEYKPQQRQQGQTTSQTDNYCQKSDKHKFISNILQHYI